MTWDTLDPAVRTIAETVCTPGELEAVKLHHTGCGYKRIALILGISPSTARDRIHNAERKIEQEIRRTA